MPFSPFKIHSLVGSFFIKSSKVHSIQSVILFEYTRISDCFIWINRCSICLFACCKSVSGLSPPVVLPQQPEGANLRNSTLVRMTLSHP